jgi:hypothetical protein
MNEIGVAGLEIVAMTVPKHLNNGQIDDAIAHFAEELTFSDPGGLEFNDRSAWLSSSARHG